MASYTRKAWVRAFGQRGICLARTPFARPVEMRRYFHGPQFVVSLELGQGISSTTKSLRDGVSETLVRVMHQICGIQMNLRISD